MPINSCPRNYSRIFDNGKCIDNMLVGIYYSIIFLFIFWLLTQCYIKKISNRMDQPIIIHNELDSDSDETTDIESEGENIEMNKIIIKGKI